jgi:single-strand DNA-binding protein
MPNLNQVNIIGHLTRDPELRYTPKGTAVAAIGLAINREWKTEAGEKKSEVVFVEVTTWARLAEVCGEYLKKGQAVFFTGRLTLESWVDKSTQQKRQRLSVVAEGMQLLGSKPADEPTRRFIDELPPS